MVILNLNVKVTKIILYILVESTFNIDHFILIEFTKNNRNRIIRKNNNNKHFYTMSLTRKRTTASTTSLNRIAQTLPSNSSFQHHKTFKTKPCWDVSLNFILLILINLI